ncbi:MAG: DcrB-related protein [Clostridia bacterium]|nr:DcrB-related protein [Clostridia bacterium]
MKRIVTLVLALCALGTLCLFVASCSSEVAPPEGMQDVTAPGESYHLYVPASWQSQANSGTSGARYGNQDKSNVTVTRFLPGSADEGKPAHYWSNRLKPSYEKQFSDFVLLEDGAEGSLGGRTGLKYVYTMTFGGIPYKQMQVLVQGADGNVYIFTYTALPEYYDAHLEEVASILAAFKF